MKIVTLLCRLYVTVITTIRGFGDLFWVDVVEQIDTMTEQVNNFQNQAKKLPKALRDWQAFVDCKKVIDDFLEELPLFQQLASKAMRPRYACLLQAMCVVACSYCASLQQCYCQD